MARLISLHSVCGVVAVCFGQRQKNQIPHSLLKGMGVAYEAYVRKGPPLFASQDILGARKFPTKSLLSPRKKVNPLCIMDYMMSLPSENA